MKPEFIQPAFICKNTPELRKKLEGIGYKLNNGKWMGKYLATFRIKDTKEWRYVASPKWDLGNNPDKDISIDCGTNEDLFLAIAALREDTDNNQFFTNGNDWAIYMDNINNIGLSGFDYYNLPHDIRIPLHKASVKEIIEYFKKEE